MADFIGLQCEKCKKEFMVRHGPTKFQAIEKLPDIEIAMSNYKDNGKVFDTINVHKNECDGKLFYNGLGFID